MSNTNTVEVENPGIPWWLVLIQGIAAIILGVLLFIRPTTTMIILIQFLGIYWLITGIFSLVSLIWDRTDLGWKVVNGILGILAGILIIRNPLWSTLLVPTTLAFLLGVIGIIIGLFQLVDAFRGGGIGVGILGGFSILLGFLLIARPVIAGLSLAWMLGGLLIVGGILAVIAAIGIWFLASQLEEAGMEEDSWSTASSIGGEESVIWDDSGAGLEPEAAHVAASVGVAGLAAAGMEAVEEEEEILPKDGGEMGSSVADDIEAAGEPTEVPEEILTGNVDTADPEEMAKFKNSLEYVEGIGPVYGEQLKAIGLVNCLDLLRAGATRKGREEIVGKSGISSKLILEWVNQVDLYRIKGVGQEYADLLEATGVDTVVELAQRNPGNLFNRMLEVNAEKNLVRKPPTLSQVEDWVSQAKGLPRVVTY